MTGNCDIYKYKSTKPCCNVIDSTSYNVFLHFYIINIVQWNRVTKTWALSKTLAKIVLLYYLLFPCNTDIKMARIRTLISKRQNGEFAK